VLTIFLADSAEKKSRTTPRKADERRGGGGGGGNPTLFSGAPSALKYF